MISSCVQGFSKTVHAEASLELTGSMVVDEINFFISAFLCLLVGISNLADYNFLNTLFG